MAEFKMEDWEFRYDSDFEGRDDTLKVFQQYGFIIVRGILSRNEHAKLKSCLENPSGVRSHYYEKDDGDGSRSRTVAWNYPMDDVTGYVATCSKIAGTFSKLLEGDLFHYHSKVIMKEAHGGGQHAWHQDYGYWYVSGFLFPNMGTVWIPIDKTDKENGCVQLLAGSHLTGRIDHTKCGQQVGADLDRVDAMKKVCPLIYAELEPGDAVFFHSNVIHRSDQNHSERRRWGMAIAYSRTDNNPCHDSTHPGHCPRNTIRIRDNEILGTCPDQPSTEEDPDYIAGPDKGHMNFEWRNVDKHLQKA